MKTVPHIHDIIDRVVSAMRSTGTITVSSESSGVYTLTTSNGLVDNDFITIDSIEYKVYSVTSTEFKIEAANGLDFTGDTWTANAPYYMHEKEPKANEILTQKTGTQKWQKYPLVLLLHPYTVNRTNNNYAEINDLRIAIINNTKSEWNSDTRYSDNFETVLEPIYDDLIQGIQDAPEFTFEMYNVPHDRIDALFLDNNPLPDKLDAILIEFDSLPVNYVTTCEPTVTPIKYTLATSVDGNTGGIISPNTGQYNAGETVKIITAPDPGYELVETTVNTVATTDAWFDLVMNEGKDVVAYFQSLAKQWFLKESPIFENGELKDYSPSSVNAEIYGKSLYQAAGGVVQYQLQDQIQVDLIQDGVHFEFIASIATGDDRTGLFADISLSTATIRLMTNGVRVYFATSDNNGANRLFSSAVPVETFKRFRLSTLSGILKVEITTPADANYTSATESTYDLSLVSNLIPFNITHIGGSVPSLNGGLIFAKMNGHIFNMAHGVDSRYLFSSNTDNYAVSTLTSILGVYQKEVVTEINGYSVLYTFTDGSNAINWQIIPFNEGVSNAENISARLTTDGINHVIEEYPNGEFFNAWGFKLDSSMEIYDQDNTYFDALSNANLITENKQPTKLNNRIYYDRLNNKDILIYDKDVIIDNSINTVGKSALIVGDSTAAAKWAEIFAYKTGLINTVESYGGQSTSGVLSNLQSAVVGNPTLVSDKDFILHCTGINDYDQNLSEATFTANIQSTIDYLVAQNSTATIVMIAPYNKSLDMGASIDDGNTPNASGLTYNIMRSVIAQKCIYNNLTYCNWNDANINLLDIPDWTHTYTATGGLKLANQTLDITNTIKE